MRRSTSACQGKHFYITMYINLTFRPSSGITLYLNMWRQFNIEFFSSRIASFWGVKKNSTGHGEGSTSNLYLAMFIYWRLSASSTYAEYTAFKLMRYTSLSIQSVYIHTLLKLNVVLYSMCICPTKCDKYLFGHHG